MLNFRYSTLTSPAADPLHHGGAPAEAPRHIPGHTNTDTFPAGFVGAIVDGDNTS